MTVAGLLDALRARGVTLEAAGDRLRYRPRDAVPPDLRALLIEQKPALLRLLARASAPGDPEVARRVALFREQIDTWATAGRSSVPLLALPGAAAPRAGACLSCGAPIPEGRWRCGPCVVAVELALGLRPTEEPAP